MVAPSRWFINQLILALKCLSGYVHRGTLPQSRIRSTAPSEREPGESAPFPGSFSEGAGSPQGLTEGVSSDGCSKPMVYSQCFGSEVFGRLRSSGYTPSVSHSLDSSLREGAGRGAYHSSYHSETARFRAIFIAPTKTQKPFPFTIQRGTLPQSRPCGRASSLREGAGGLPFIRPAALDH